MNITMILDDDLMSRYLKVISHLDSSNCSDEVIKNEIIDSLVGHIIQTVEEADLRGAVERIKAQALDNIKNGIAQNRAQRQAS